MLRLSSAAEVARVAPRLSRRTWLVVGAVVVLLVGGAVAYGLLKPEPPSGRLTVQRYFDDLASGDTASALTRVASAQQYRASSYPLLTAKALEGPASRPSGLRILSSGPTQGTPSRGETQSTEVSYRLGDTTVRQTLLAVRETGGDADFLLAQPFLRFSARNAGGRAVTVNSVNLDPRAAQDTLVFPGVYTATAQGNALLSGDAKPAVVQGAGQLLVTFAQPALAGGAQEAVTRQVRQALDQCARSTSAQPTGCPFSVYLSDRNASVTWRITSYPTTSVTVSSYTGGQVDIRSTASGVAHYDASYTDYAGTARTASGDQRFSVSGRASAAGSTITLTIN